MKLYFAYGANLNLAGMRFRCPAARPIQSLELKDWTLAFNGVATILESPGSVVHGALWELTDECEDALDIFEGYPYLYTKIHLEQDGLQFMVYIMNEDNPAPPSKYYLNTIREGYQDWKLPVRELHRVADQYLHATN